MTPHGIPIHLRTRPAIVSANATDVVYILSTASWEAMSRRGFFMPEDQLALSLLGSDRVGRLLICDHPRSRPVKAVRDLSRSTAAPFPEDNRTQLVQPLRLRRRDPTTLWGAKRGFAAYDRAIERAVRSHGLRDPVAIIAHPIAAGFAQASWARSVTWYAIDDWTQHPAYSRWRRVYGESYARIRDDGRRVAAVSRVLHERVAPTGASVVVPNGLNPHEWTERSAPPTWLAASPRPLCVYAGTLDSRIDVGSVQALARAMPSATIVFVGPLVDPDHLAPLRDLANVRFCSPMGRGSLAGLIRSADVGLLPHRVTPLTAAMSPLKVLEYLAAGLPVAATDLPPVREFGHPRVALVSENGDYVDGVRAALGHGRAPENERLEFIEANSWRSRHEQVLDLAII